MEKKVLLSKKLHPIIILTGFSRGASTCYQLAKELDEKLDFEGYDDSEIHLWTLAPIVGSFDWLKSILSKHMFTKKVKSVTSFNMVITENPILLKQLAPKKEMFDEETIITVLPLNCPEHNKIGSDFIDEMTGKFIESLLSPESKVSSNFFSDPKYQVIRGSQIYCIAGPKLPNYIGWKGAIKRLREAYGLK